MIGFDQLDAMTDPILDLYEQYMVSVINDIARRLAGMNFASASQAWQMQRLIESGRVYEHAIEELSKLTGKSERELKKLFKAAGVRATRFDDAIYRAAGLKPMPLHLSPAMARVLAAGLRKTGNVMRNLTMTTAISAQDLFVRAADLAYMQVSSGAFSYTEAIRNAVKDVAGKGLQVINYASGKRDQLDVAMRRTVLTGVSQTAGNLQLARADEMFQDLVQVSAHIGARNVGEGPRNHESWQGKIYSRSGTHPKYKPFIATTGYGTAEGLHGVNCRHSFYPFFEGISEKVYSQSELDSYASKTVIYNGKELSVYEATQKQRAIERKIRYWKRQAGALEAAGEDNTFERLKMGEWQAEMRKFVKETGLIRQPEREQVAGVSLRALTKRPNVQPNFFDWEVKELRQTLSFPLSNIDESGYQTVIVPRNILDKIRESHGDDVAYLNRLSEVLTNWDYVGESPKGIGKIEFYKNLDEIWFTAVVKGDRKLQIYILTTFHRIYKRKMESRIAKGYLQSR